MTSALASCRRLNIELRPDPSRVIAKLFVPGHSTSTGADTQVDRVLAHLLATPEEAVSRRLGEVTRRFKGRHRQIEQVFLRNAARVTSRLRPDTSMSSARLLLVGATFTHEYSVDAAALCNPSACLAPDQSDVAAGDLRFVMSVRQIGEGHRSSIGFRTGLLHSDGDVTIEPASAFATTGTRRTPELRASDFGQLDDGSDEITAWILDRLGEAFSREALDAELHVLETQADTRRNVEVTVGRMRSLADRFYEVDFDPETPLSERVLYPAVGIEASGLEDARLVRFVEPDGSTRYLATYTAYDGRRIEQQLLETTDFTSFAMSPLLGPAAANKGLALFPRKVGGRYLAVARHDGERMSIASSADLRHWPTPTPLPTQTPHWSVVQAGNCGPPIETEGGWLLLTHGVGPMRTYSIGACLLDLDDPTTLIGQLREPLLSPGPHDQDGYVPNVVYSCGAVRNSTHLLMPLGIADARIGFATVTVEELLDRLVRG